MKPLVALGMLATGLACLCCSSFSPSEPPPSGDGGTDSGAADSGVPCFEPGGGCPASTVCCVEPTGTASCTDVASCGIGRAHLECKRSSDCAMGSSCCVEFGAARTATGDVFLVQTSCRAGGCTAIQKRVCTTGTECAAGMTCQPVAGKAVPANVIANCL